MITPLDESAAVLAHSALGGYLYRSETALGLMAKMSGRIDTARLHLTVYNQRRRLMMLMQKCMRYQLGLGYGVW